MKEILVRNINEPFFREAAINGLAGREKEFLDLLGDDFEDAKFRKYLEHCLTPKTTAAAFKAPRDKEHLASFKRGEKFYITNCMACHGSDGNGLELLGPPLVKSEWVLESPERLSAILLQGLTGPIEVSGTKYTPAAAMPGLKDAPEISDEILPMWRPLFAMPGTTGRGRSRRKPSGRSEPGWQIGRPSLRRRN